MFDKVRDTPVFTSQTYFPFLTILRQVNLKVMVSIRFWPCKWVWYIPYYLIFNSPKSSVPTHIPNQPLEVLYEKGVLKTFARFTENLCVGLFFNNVAGLRPETLLIRDSGTSVFLWILRNFFLVTNGCFFTFPACCVSHSNMFLLKDF